MPPDGDPENIQREELLLNADIAQPKEFVFNVATGVDVGVITGVIGVLNGLTTEVAAGVVVTGNVFG